MLQSAIEESLTGLVWDVPDPPWILHSTPLLGNLTERWIEVQIRAARRYGARLLGLQTVEGAGREPHWLLVGDRFDLWLAYKGMFKSGGLSTAWLATQFRGEREPAALHVHYGPPAAQLRPLARVLGRPLITSFYGYDATHNMYREQWLLRKRYERLFRDGTAFVAEGPAMGRRLEGLGCPPEKIHVVRLPADAAGLEDCIRPKAESFRVAIAGRFSEKKGFDVAIRAFARALKGRPDAELLLIGGGELEPDFRKLVADQGISDQVVWRGRLPFSDFMGEVATARVGLYPSRTDSEGASEGGAPVTLAEAQWLHVPAMVSDHDDLPFVAAPEASIVLPPLAVDEWADALLALYERPGRAEEMGAAASEFVRRHHSPEANAAARERVYDAVAASSS